MNKASIIDTINAKLASDTTTLPVISSVCLEIRGELEKEEPSRERVEALIGSDPGLTFQLLRLANSSFYKGLNEIGTIRDAMTRLGMDETSNLVLLATQKKLYQATDPSVCAMMATLWRHAVVVALAAKLLTRQCGFHHLSSDAFFAGLLHDVGALFLLTVMDEIKTDPATPFAASDALIKEVLMAAHASQGYALMKRWNLPEKICLIARDHHQEAIDPNNPLLLIVRLANLAANKLRIGLNPCPEHILAATDEAIALGLSEIDMAQIEIALEDAEGLSV